MKAKLPMIARILLGFVFFASGLVGLLNLAPVPPDLPQPLVILAPVVLNIFLVHAFLAPSGLVLATILGLLMIYLSFFAQPYAGVIKQLFRAK